MSTDPRHAADGPGMGAERGPDDGGTVPIRPSVLYWGTPVVLLSTLNEDGSTNVAPISSVWWLGWGAMIGLTSSAHSAANLQRVGECVLNLPSVDIAGKVDRLARTTGADPVPPDKAWLTFEHVADKFGHAGLTPEPSLTVRPDRVADCHVQMEATVASTVPFGAANPLVPMGVAAIELDIRNVHVHPSIVMPDTTDHIDPDRWRPLIMSFRSFYGLGDRVDGDTLASVPEARWRPPLLGRSSGQARDPVGG